MIKPIRPLKQDVHAVVLVPSETDWQALRHAYEELRPGIALGREFLSRNFGLRRVVFVHTGADPVAAAVSAQYAVDRWSPRLLASNTESDAFSHVAARNGLQLLPVENLGLNASVAPPPVPAAPGGVPDGADVAPPVEITTIADVTTTDDVSTTDDVGTISDERAEEEENGTSAV